MKGENGYGRKEAQKILRSQKGREGGRAKMSNSSLNGVALHSVLQKVFCIETLFLEISVK